MGPFSVFVLLLMIYPGYGYNNVTRYGGEPAPFDGKRAADGEVPWIVSLRRFSDTSLERIICSGVIISRNFILTLASCTNEYYGPSYMAIISGSLMSSGHGGAKHQAVSITKHEDFNEMNRANDIALVEIFPPIQFSERAYPIGLPFKDAELQHNFLIMVAGFINYQEGIAIVNSPIMKIPVAVVDFDICRESFEGSPNLEYVTPDTVCAANLNLGCEYNRGGPLYFNGVLYGLIKSDLLPCGEEYFDPGLYTKISLYVDWIRQHAQIYPINENWNVF